MYDFIENAFDEERPPMPYQAMEMGNGGSEQKTPNEPTLNMDIQHSKTMPCDGGYLVSSVVAVIQSSTFVLKMIKSALHRRDFHVPDHYS